MENVEPGDVDRHVSVNCDAGRDLDDQKNIELSVAEVQVLPQNFNKKNLNTILRH